MDRSAIADLWRVTLSQIPAEFGRLVYLASLRNPNTGRYSHAGLASRCGELLADEAMRQSHERVLRQWLCLSLEEQRGDCELYWSSLLEPRATLLEMWIRTEPYNAWLPAAASPAERRNFDFHMKTMLSWIRRDSGGASHQEARPLQ